MNSSAEIDSLLIDRIRQGDSDAWEELIGRYEGRLLAFVDSRLGKRSAAEDIVQEAFIGFLNSLPNYDGRRPLESYLFSICAYKLTDHLRREGRRPTIPLSSSSGNSEGGTWDVAGKARVASSIARSSEQRNLEETAIVAALQEQVSKWQERGDWQKMMCIELLFVTGLSNKEASQQLDITEQQVANYKFDFLSRTKSLVGRQQLDAEIFPELSE